MTRKLRYVVVSALLLILSSCFQPTPLKIDLYAPYYAQWMHNYCAAACIKMWAECVGSGVYTQDTIASYINVGATGAAPADVVAGVGFFTYSPGYLKLIEEFIPGAQGDLLSACVRGIKESVPAIVPFDFGNHAALIKGFEWHEDSNDPYSRPIADVVYYNDPDPSVGEPKHVSVLYFKSELFLPTYDLYYVILGDEWYYDEGVVEHDEFVYRRGTYYGGPYIYNPKGLVLNTEPPSID